MMDFEESMAEFVRNLENNSASSLQKEAERSARSSTSTSTTATATVTVTDMKTSTTTGIKKIKEEEEEEDDILGTKTRNWRKINLSFTVVLEGQDGEDIRETDRLHKGNNGSKTKHHSIMSKIAKFMIAVEKEM
jgi:hypothetical protein